MKNYRKLPKTTKNYLVKSLLLIIVLFVNFNSQSQSVETNFNDHHYLLIDSNWHLFYPGKNKLIKTENLIYVKSYSMTSSNINFIENNYGVNHINTILEHFYVFSLGSNINLLPAIQSIDSLSFVKECGLDVIGESHAVPNDPEYLIKQWGLKSNLYGTGVDSAWTITTGDSNIVVAVIDNGVDFYHPDLGMGTDGYENIYKNPGEDPWAGPIDPITGNGVGNGIDDDGNGYIDDWKGWNFYSNSPIGTKNSNYYFGGANAVNNHGTSCAGIIAAKSNNSKGVSGIAGGWGANGVKILPINTGPYPFNSTFPKVMDYLIKMKVDIISVSSGGGSPYNTNPVLDSLLELAYKSNISIVFSSGNEANNSLPWAPDVQFPANSKYTLGVGAYDYNGIRKNYSNYGPLLDIAAPTDFYTISTVYGPYDYFGGTSAAAPHVAGIIALMKSINKCLSTSEVYEIIKKTADTSGLYNHYWNNSKPKHSKEFGYGRINAFEAVKMAQSTKSNTLDLYIKDDENDFGLEPNDNSNHFYLSSDIWTRNSNDGIEKHQNPEYDPVSPVYVNVRIRNKSCVDSDSTDKLFVHWTKAGTNLGFPNSWNGSTSSPTLGDLLDSVVIPIIPAGEERVITIPWVIPNPSDYTSVGNNMWHFCLLARIISDTDTMLVSETGPLNAIKYNNNIALKNLTIVDSAFGGGGGGSSIRRYSGTISVGNNTSDGKTIDLKFFSDNSQNGSIITDVSDILLEVDDNLKLKLQNANPPYNFIEDNKILINKNELLLSNLYFAPNETSTLNITFLFEAESEIPQNEYQFHINQIDASTQEVTGGELFVIYPPAENLDLNANAGDDQTTGSNENITLTAEYVAGDVEYRWFDEDGNLVAEGMDLTINNGVSETYQLVVFDLINGITDDDYVNVTIDDHEIESISPNPTNTGQIDVHYNIDGTANAYLMVIENGIIRNYMVTNTTSKIIQTSNFSNGTHTILLICDGVIKDSKQFVKL